MSNNIDHLDVRLVLLAVLVQHQNSGRLNRFPSLCLLVLGYFKRVSWPDPGFFELLPLAASEQVEVSILYSCSIPGAHQRLVAVDFQCMPVLMGGHVPRQ